MSHWLFPNSEVMRVIDGDTFVARVDHGCNIQSIREVRLKGINCPELKGPNSAAGQAARYAAEQLLRTGPVDIESHAWDKYRRLEAVVKLSDGRDLATVLVESGHAVKEKR